MKKIRFTAALIIGGIILVALTGCFSDSGNDAVKKSALPFAVQDATSSYEQAVDKITSTGSYRMNIDTTKITTIGKQNYTETSAQVLSCKDLGLPEEQFILNEYVNYGAHSFSVCEQYTDGAAYITLDNSHFSSAISKEDYTNRLIPVALMDPSRYQSILTHQIGERTMIGFSEPTAPEPWAVSEDIQLNDASGRAVLDAEGNLVESCYSLSYTSGPATITYSVNATFEPDAEITIPAIEDYSLYTNIDFIDVPRLLEQATGYLLQANAIDSETQETIVCQANNLRREQRTHLSMNNRDHDLDITLGIDVDLIDYNQGGTSTKYHQTETYKDGQYTLAVENKESSQTHEGEITAERMQLYCQDILVGTIILPEYIEGVSVVPLENAYQLIFSASEKLSEIVCSDACQTLYQDPALLNSLSSSYRTDKIESTLVIDKQTGLPVSSGIDYSGSHTIEGTSYTLNSVLTQTYDFNND